MVKHNVRLNKMLALLAISAGISSPVWAVDKEDINFSGFASLVYAKSLDETSTIEGISDEGEYRDFNVLGLRVDANLHDRVSVAVQLSANGLNNYDPEFQWIYANIQLMDNLDARVGRMRIPLFMYSDYLDVGYAHNWVKPPEAVYGDIPFRSFEGASLNYSQPLGILTSSLQVYGGRVQEDLEEGGAIFKLDAQDARGFAWTLGYDWLEARASYFESEASGDMTVIPALTPVLALFQGVQGIIGGNFMDDILYEKDGGYFAGLGLSMDFENFFLLAEKTQVRNSSMLLAGDTDSYYLTGGIRPVEKWTFSLTYSHDKNEYDTGAERAYNKALQNFIVTTGLLPGDDNFDLLGTGIPDMFELQTVGGMIRQIGYSAVTKDDDSYILNARWDFHAHADAKLEYIYKAGEDVSTGKKANNDAVRIAIDLVF